MGSLKLRGLQVLDETFIDEEFRMFVLMGEIKFSIIFHPPTRYTENKKKKLRYLGIIFIVNAFCIQLQTIRLIFTTKVMQPL